MSDAFQVPPLVDYGATLLWALSGGLVAARQGYDVVGIFGVALVAATGGGLLRDGLFLQDGPPLLVRNPIYLSLVAAAAVIVVLLGRRVQRLRYFTETISLFDAIGLGAYAVVGAQLAQQRDLPLLGVVLVSVVTAVGGGVLRDVVMRREPEVFKPGTLVAIAALVGCCLFLLFTRSLRMGEVPAAWLTIVAVLGLRLLSVTYGWKTRAVLEGDERPPGGV